MAKTHGGKGDRIPGANPAAYEAGYAGIDWNARERTQLVMEDGDGNSVALCPEHGAGYGKGCVRCDRDLVAMTGLRYG